MLYKVKVGEEFEVEVVSEPEDNPSGKMALGNTSPEGVLEKYGKILQERVVKREANVRLVLSFSILFILATALLVAVVYGWQNGDFSAVQTIWNVGSIFLTSVTTYYFVEKNVDRNKEDEDSD